MARLRGLDGSVVHRFEAVFCIFLAGIAFLWRDDRLFSYPEILYLFGGLLALNLLASLCLKLWPERDWLAAGITLANCGTVTGILAYSGGYDSKLWVLYLLPVYTSAMLLSGRELALVAGGAVILNASYHFMTGSHDPSAVFMLALKTGVLALGAAATGIIARRERRAQRELEAHRRSLERLSGRLEAQKADLRRAEGMAEAGLVAAGVAHDLNNAFTVIQGVVELLRSTDLSARDVSAELRLLARSTEFCRGVVGAMVDSVKDREFSLVPGDVHDLLEECLVMYGATLRDAGVEVRLRTRGVLPEAAMSRTHLERVFLNLMANAKDAMRSGGSLDITAETLPGPDPAGPRTVVVVFEDTGPGIPPEAMKDLFKPLKTTKGDKGAGLGLYLCREIAIRHGGTIYAENRLGGGARFVLRLQPACVLPPARVPATDLEAPQACGQAQRR